MAEATKTEREPKKKLVSVSPFMIEAANPRNCDLYIQVTGTRLRSRIRPVKDVIDRRNGEQITRPVSSKMLDELPGDIPGQHMKVIPGNLTYEVIDPVTADTLDQVRAAMKAHSGMSVGQKLRPVPKQEGKLDKDQMKTLVRELVRIVNSGEAVIVKGTLPTEEEIEELPGKFLQNARNLSNWHQPRYEEQMEEWTEKLNRLD